MEFLSCFVLRRIKTIRLWVCRRSLDFCHCDSGAELLQLVIVRMIYESKKRVLLCPSRSRLFWWIGSCSCNFQSSKTTTGVLRAEGTGAVKGQRSEAKRNNWRGTRFAGSRPFMPDSLYPCTESKPGRRQPDEHCKAMRWRQPRTGLSPCRAWPLFGALRGVHAEVRARRMTRSGRGAAETYFRPGGNLPPSRTR
jgi:hypothetical protein